MKLKDIEPLIYCGSNGVTIDLEYLPNMLEQFDKTYGLDMDPEFQRGHVWPMDVKIKFLEYILRGGVAQPIRFNSPCFGGWNHEKHSDLPETVVLVDGKQRLSACLEFIYNRIPVFEGNYLKDFDDHSVFLRRVSLTYFVNRLQTKRELYKWYLEMNEGQIAHTPEELDKVRNLIKTTK